MPIVNPTDIFYKASIAETYAVLNATTVSSQFAGGALTPGRWLLQVIPSADTVVVWVKLGAASGGALTATTAGAAKQMPLSQKTLIAIEFNVNNNFNDAPPAVICSAGTAVCYLTRISEG